MFEDYEGDTPKSVKSLEEQIAEIKVDEKRRWRNGGERRCGKRYCSLPLPFRKRMDRLREKTPDRPSWEAYELYVLKEAVKIGRKFKTPEKIDEFRAGPDHWLLMPELHKGHSPNTLGCAINTAWRWVQGLEL